MSIKLDFVPETLSLSIKLTATETKEVHGSFLEMLRRLAKKAKQVNLDLTDVERVDNTVLLVLEELRELSGESTIILRTKKGSEAEVSMRAIFENRQPIFRH